MSAVRRSPRLRLPPISRRDFLRGSARTTGALAVSLFGQALAAPGARADGAAGFGPLQPPDANGLRLPAGFSSRVVAVTGSQVAASGYAWHGAPDGGATFATPDGGWVYVSNSERVVPNGGVGALRFDALGEVVDGYPILSGTSVNCAGGATPWSTWLSCEEVNLGSVFECDPYAPGSEGVERPALGTFKHEAVAVDPVHRRLYLTEDQGDGLLYRFTPHWYPSLAAGTLEAMEILDPGGDGPIAPGETRPVAWSVVPNPNPGAFQTPTRQQVPGATTFARGEGCWWAAGFFYFATTSSHRVWKLDTSSDTIEILYDAAVSSNPELRQPDNVLATDSGDVYVAEDGDDLQIVALTSTGLVVPFMQLTGKSGTEITGPALSPDGTRIYFSEQRSPGTTYEVTGPFGASGGPFVPSVPALGTGAAGLLAAALAAAAAWRLRGGTR